jgi:hypothetical protein
MSALCREWERDPRGADHRVGGAGELRRRRSGLRRRSSGVESPAMQLCVSHPGESSHFRTIATPHPVIDNTRNCPSQPHHQPARFHVGGAAVERPSSLSDSVSTFPSVAWQILTSVTCRPLSLSGSAAPDDWAESPAPSMVRLGRRFVGGTKGPEPDMWWLNCGSVGSQPRSDGRLRSALKIPGTYLSTSWSRGSVHS